MNNRIETAQRTLEKADLILSPAKDLIERVQANISVPITFHPLPLLSKLSPTPIPPMPYRFVFASSIIPTKGLHLLLDAIQKVPTAELWVVGKPHPFDGWPNYFEEQHKQIMRLPNTKYLGEVEHQKIPGILSQAHCLVLPSLWPENSPIVIREALALGLEVICAKEGGAKEISAYTHTIMNGSTQELCSTMKKVMTYPKRNPSHSFPSMKDHAISLCSLYTK
jgi:glycosyltransferase involved in cell wall biosynthesis